VNDGNEKAQEVGAMALFNLAVNNNRYCFLVVWLSLIVAS
jgi:hypothetical protein